MGLSKRYPALVAAATIVSLATACSSSASSSSAGSSAAGSSPAGSSSGVAAGTFKVGALQDLSGAIAAYGQYELKGTEVAVAEFNAAGGLNGQKAVLDQFDTGSSTTQVIPGLRKLISDGDVGVIGPSTSTEMLVATPTAKSSKIVLIPASSAAVVPAGVLNDYVFRVAPISTESAFLAITTKELTTFKGGG